MISNTFVVIDSSDPPSPITDYLVSYGHTVETFNKVFMGTTRIYWGGIEAIVVVVRDDTIKELVELVVNAPSMPVVLINMTDKDLNYLAETQRISDIVSYHALPSLMERLEFSMVRCRTRGITKKAIKTESHAQVFTKLEASCSNISRITKEISLHGNTN